MAFVQVFVYFHILVLCICSELPGHLKPIGHHRPPVDDIEARSTFPPPSEFYRDYVKASKPVLFEGILEKGFLPAYKLWTDEFLKTTYGKDIVAVELGKKEERGAGGDSYTLSHFLEVYQKENIYMVNDVSENMANDVNIPRSIACGGFQTRIQHVILWFSSGGTKSVLHNDGLDNINCLIDGEKYFVLIDKKQSALIETEHWKKNGSYHSVDVEKVDMVKYPQFQDVSWHEVKMKKGDCLFIPFRWYHHVDSSFKGRNMALNFWFTHMLEFNDTDCKDVNIDEPVSFSSVRKSTYDLESIRDEMMGVFDDVSSISLNEFQEIMEGTQVIDRDSAGKLFKHIDMDNDLQITPIEMQTFDFKKAVKEIPKLETSVSEYLGAADSESGDQLEGGEQMPKTDQINKVQAETHEEL